MALFKKRISTVKLNEILTYIKHLKNNPYPGWSEAHETGYITACKSIEKKITDVLNDMK